MTSGNNRKAALATVVFLCWWSGHAWSADAWGLGDLMHGLSSVKSSRATFVEKKTLAILNAPIEMTGTLVYVAPSHLEKHTLTPKAESMVLDEDKLVLEDKVRNRKRTVMLQDYPMLWALVESIRSTLAGDLETLHRFYKVDFRGTAAQWNLTLVPSEPKMLAMVKQISIAGVNSRIGTIEIDEAEGNHSEMTITEETQ